MASFTCCDGVFQWWGQTFFRGDAQRWCPQTSMTPHITISSRDKHALLGHKTMKQNVPHWCHMIRVGWKTHWKLWMSNSESWKTHWTHWMVLSGACYLWIWEPYGPKRHGQKQGFCLARPRWIPGVATPSWQRAPLRLGLSGHLHRRHCWHHHGAILWHHEGITSLQPLRHQFCDTMKASLLWHH